MKHIKTHILEPESATPTRPDLDVIALDELGHGGAHHVYAIECYNPSGPFYGKRPYESYCAAVGGLSFNGQALPTWEQLVEKQESDSKTRLVVAGWMLAATAAPIVFQHGPIQEHGRNGVTHEALLAILIDRLECFEAGPYACMENAAALMHLRCALTVLHNRTAKRVARNVEGTHKI